MPGTKARRAGDPGIVDEDVHGPGIGGGGHRGIIGQFDHPDALGPDLDCRCLEGPGIAVPKLDRRTAGRKAAGDREADALRAAGDDRAAAVEVDLVNGILLRAG